MKILICGMNYVPELTGIGKYSGEMAEWFAQRGHEVRVVTAPPYYPEWKVHADYSSIFYRFEEINGVGIWRCPVYVPRQPTGLKRIVHLLSFALSSLPIILRYAFWRPDVVLAIEPPLFCAPAAWLTGRLSGAKCWLHVQDFEVDAAFALGLLSSAGMQKHLRSVEGWLMRRFDGVSSISEKMVQRLGQRGIPSQSAVLFRNWSDLEHMRCDPDGAATFRLKHQLGEDTKLALYAGNMGEKQGLRLLLEAAESLRHEDIYFVLCGEGSARKQLIARAENLDNVMFLDLQPISLFRAMLSAADVHLVVQRADAADLVMPSKLTNIMAVGGRSIVTSTVDSELGCLFTEHPYLGELSQPGSAEGFIACLKSVLEQPASKNRQAIRAYAEQHLAKEVILQGFENELVKLSELAGDED